MTLDLHAKECFFGQIMAEYFQTLPGELLVDAVGLWQFVPTGRQGFGLDGDDLVEFVRLCVLALLDHGAKPVIGGGGTQYDWLLQPQYGESNEDIANAVVNEWLTAGAKDCDPGDLWFALPSPFVGSQE